MLPHIIASFGLGIVGGVVGTMIYFNTNNNDKVYPDVKPTIIDIDEYYIDEFELQ